MSTDGWKKYATTQLKPEDILLNDRNWHKGTQIIGSHSHEVPKGSQLHRDRKKNGGCQGLGEGRGSSCFRGMEFPFWKSRVGRGRVAMVAGPCECRVRTP